MLTTEEMGADFAAGILVRFALVEKFVRAKLGVRLTGSCASNSHLI
jgi:hypothetical protein